MAIIDFFDRGWSINPQGAAYIQDGRSCSFTEVGELSCRAEGGVCLANPKGEHAGLCVLEVLVPGSGQP